MLTLQDVARTAEAQRRFPNWILWLLGVVFAVWAIGSMADALPWQGSDSGNIPMVPVIQPFDSEPVAQPVQPFDSAQSKQEPVVEVAPVVKELPKVHVEWIKIGTARNGNEVIALGMPRGDEFIPVPVEVVDNLPPGATGIGGFPTGRGTVVLYTYVQTEPWVYTYWKTKTEIPLSALEGLSP